MQKELSQSVLGVAGKNGSVISASLAAFLTGTANFFEVLQPILGSIAMVTTTWIAIAIFRKRDRLLQKELDLKDAQIASIDERKEKRGNSEPT